MVYVARFQRFWHVHRTSVLLLLVPMGMFVWLNLLPVVLLECLAMSVLGWNEFVVPLFGMPMATMQEAQGALFLVVGIGGIQLMVRWTMRMGRWCYTYVKNVDSQD